MAPFGGSQKKKKSRTTEYLLESWGLGVSLALAEVRVTSRSSQAVKQGGGHRAEGGAAKCQVFRLSKASLAGTAENHYGGIKEIVN